MPWCYITTKSTKHLHSACSNGMRDLQFERVSYEVVRSLERCKDNSIDRETSSSNNGHSCRCVIPIGDKCVAEANAGTCEGIAEILGLEGKWLHQPRTCSKACHHDCMQYKALFEAVHWPGARYDAWNPTADGMCRGVKVGECTLARGGVRGGACLLLLVEVQPPGSCCRTMTNASDFTLAAGETEVMAGATLNGSGERAAGRSAW